jgi:Regulator of ribonuclease activity B/Domain of unknown function (DUF4440)
VAREYALVGIGVPYQYKVVYSIEPNLLEEQQRAPQKRRSLIMSELFARIKAFFGGKSNPTSPLLSSRTFMACDHPLRPALDRRYLDMRAAMAAGDPAAIAAILADGFTSTDVNGRTTFSGAMIESVNRLQIDRSKRVVATTLTEITFRSGQAIVLQHYSMTSAPDAPQTMPKMLQTLSIDTWLEREGVWLLARTQTREAEVVDAYGRRRYTKNLAALGDDDLLKQLESHGSDLSKPTDLVFYLYIPSESDANAAATELDRLGYQAAVNAPLGKLQDGTTEDRFSVVSHLTAIPMLTIITGAANTMAGLADQYNGEYDGWEAAIQQ